MKKVAAILLLGLSSIFSQISWENLVPVRPTDPALPALTKWQQKIAASYAKSGVIKASFSSWFELPSDSLERLFPHRRFFMIGWFESAVPGKEKEVSGPGGAEYTLLCDTEGKLVSEIHHYGNYDPYGDLLARSKVTIRSAEDAKLVWDAFCDLHQKQWQKQPAIQISDTVWHLGDVTIEKMHYFYEVLLDEDQMVKSARLRAESTGKPASK